MVFALSVCSAWQEFPSPALIWQVERVERCQGNDGEAKEPRKTEKVRQKVVFFLLKTLVFLAKRPKKGSFLLSVRFYEGRQWSVRR